MRNDAIQFAQVVKMCLHSRRSRMMNVVHCARVCRCVPNRWVVCGDRIECQRRGKSDNWSTWFVDGRWAKRQCLFIALHFWKMYGELFKIMAIDVCPFVENWPLRNFDLHWRENIVLIASLTHTSTLLWLLERYVHSIKSQRLKIVLKIESTEHSIQRDDREIATINVNMTEAHSCCGAHISTDTWFSISIRNDRNNADNWASIFTSTFPLATKRSLNKISHKSFK